MLADLGAEVIKVEPPPAGDAFRHFLRPSAAVSPIFANCNRGKRSVSPNLKDADQRARLLRLVASSDVWVSNWRPGVAERLGLGDEALLAANGRLIRAYITGYGPQGPAAGDPVFDLIVQAASGVTHASSPGRPAADTSGFPRRQGHVHDDRAGGAGRPFCS